MKIAIRILLSALLIFLGIKLLVPYHAYPIENFEYWILNIFPVSWKVVAILSRLLVGVLFIAAFLLLFYYPKIKWVAYLSVLMLAIPFVVNTIYPEQLVNHSIQISEELSFPLDLKTDQPVLLAYLSYNCFHCKEAAIKLKTAQKINKNFPKVIAVTYNEKLDSFFIKNSIGFPIEIISSDDFLKITEGSYPKFELVQNGKIITKYDPYQLNYGVMDDLSK